MITLLKSTPSSLWYLCDGRVSEASAASTSEILGPNKLLVDTKGRAARCETENLGSRECTLMGCVRNAPGRA